MFLPLPQMYGNGKCDETWCKKIRQFVLSLNEFNIEFVALFRHFLLVFWSRIMICALVSCSNSLHLMSKNFTHWQCYVYFNLLIFSVLHFLVHIWHVLVSENKMN